MHEQTSHFTKLSVALVVGLVGFGRMALAEARPISFAEVERVALEQLPSASIESIERETRRGQLVYEVDLSASDGVRYELLIDAYDGKLLSKQVDD